MAGRGRNDARGAPCLLCRAAPAHADGDALLFGPETRGLPDEVPDAIPAAPRLRLPMRPGNRSLNLSNAVAVAVFEAWRQHLAGGA